MNVINLLQRSCRSDTNTDSIDRSVYLGHRASFSFHDSRKYSLPNLKKKKPLKKAVNNKPYTLLLYRK